MVKEVLKIQIGRNREYLKELDNPVNEVESAVNKQLKFDIKKFRKQHFAIKSETFKPVKKLPLIDDLKFTNM